MRCLNGCWRRDDHYQTKIFVVWFFFPTGFIAWLEHRLAADGPVSGDQVERRVEESSLLSADQTEGGETKAEIVIFLNLRRLDVAVFVQDLESELPGPAGAAEQLADDTMVAAFALLPCRITGVTIQAAHQHLEPPADGPQQAGGDEAVGFSLGIAGPQIRL